MAARRVALLEPWVCEALSLAASPSTSCWQGSLCAALAADLPPQMDKMYAVGGVSVSHDLSEDDSTPKAIHPLPTLLEKCIVTPLKTQ